MEKILKSLKTNTLVSSLIWAALGLVILIWTDVSIRLLCYFLGAVLIIQGIASGISYFKLKEENLYRTFGILFGAVLLAAGIWAAARPDMFQSLIPTVVSILLLLHGAQDFSYTIQLKKAGFAKWRLALLLSLVIIAAGFLILLRPGFLTEFITTWTGICLLIDGIADFLIWRFFSEAGKKTPSVSK